MNEDGSVRIGVDMDTDEAEKDLSSLGKSVGDKLGSAFAAVGKAAAAATAAAAAGVAAIGKEALASYAEYEQLAGGVDTLFKDSSDTVKAYAEEAYKTAGLSANEYMSTVTGFSAALISSLDGDTEAAASAADMAIRDMADNANKMGTSIESIQNAYQGFAKQNYTMLDNLKLGYGGTKEEMQRLLDDAGKISGIKFDISSFADITQAIHIMQEEMGIAGATAAEAEGTISGSLSAMKASWHNLTVGIADENADIDALAQNFADSIATAGENILPRVQAILEGIGVAVEKLAPLIIEYFPKIAGEILPPLLSTAGQLIDSLLQTLIDSIPELVPIAIDMITQIAKTLIQNIPVLLAAIPEIITALVKGFGEAFDELKEVGRQLIGGMWEGIKERFTEMKQNAKNLVTGLVSDVKGVLGIHSPSRVFAEIGENMMAGMAQGIDHNADAAMRATESAVGDLTRAASFGGLVSSVPAIARGELTPQNRVFSSIVSAEPAEDIGSMIRQMGDMFSSAIAAQRGGQEVTLRLVSDSGFARALKVELDRQDQLRGVKLVRGRV